MVRDARKSALLTMRFPSSITDATMPIELEPCRLDLFDAAALHRALDRRETADVGQHLVMRHRIRRLALRGAAERLEIVAHRRMRRKEDALRHLVTMDGDDIPPGRIFRMGAIADFHPAS